MLYGKKILRQIYKYTLFVNSYDIENYLQYFKGSMPSSSGSAIMKSVLTSSKVALGGQWQMKLAIKDLVYAYQVY